jgi:hypothetical protein
MVCVDTPTNPVVVTELEGPCDGGPNGTNENCSVAENIGTVTQSNSIQVTGVLTNSGNDGTYLLPNDDMDAYLFTSGEDGWYQVTLDCFTTGSDGNWMEMDIIDGSCSSTAWSGNNYAGGPFTTSIFDAGSLPAGSQLYIGVFGIAGQPLMPYRISVDPIPPPLTPTPTP